MAARWFHYPLFTKAESSKRIPRRQELGNGNGSDAEFAQSFAALGLYHLPESRSKPERPQVGQLHLSFRVDDGLGPRILQETNDRCDLVYHGNVQTETDSSIVPRVPDSEYGSDYRGRMHWWPIGPRLVAYGTL